LADEKSRKPQNPFDLERHAERRFSGNVTGSQSWYQTNRSYACWWLPFRKRSLDGKDFSFAARRMLQPGLGDLFQKSIPWTPVPLLTFTG
jgi:hypothetical protein